ncbi:hypothetical protein MYX65_01205 [Acidobacteria bacterium AH-259-L09]|nr:hypothetical protein [Acidobacteria bacterium AH-259-L09]
MSVRRFVTLLVCLSFGLTLTLAQTIRKESLRGLEGVHVPVVAEEPIIEAGLSEHQLQIDVELRLRKAGIKVVTEDEMWDVPGRPMLWVSVSGVETRLGYAYHIDLRLEQTVFLLRDLEKIRSGLFLTLSEGNRPERLAHYRKLTDLQKIGATWEATDIIGVTPSDSLRRTVREAVADMVDQFINDYLAVNPKQ